jgi:erythronate-4-phosphate dehydrogenase
VLKIVADVDLPFLDDMFAGRASVVRLKGSAITPEAVRDADAVVVRSVTKVDERLLAGSAVKIVGSATIGTDHVDTPWLSSRGIAFANAPGCNANAVSEYVTAALLEISGALGFRLRGSTIGVIGAGNVGSRVAAKAAALGMRVLLNDPPLARSAAPGRYLPLDELMSCDVVTLHVPLTKQGPDATHHLFGAARIGSMKRGAVLFNTARGPVVDTPALAGSLREGRLAAAAIDVWEGEPSVDPSLLSVAAIATPHIAGYSNDGKAKASMMMYDAFCAHFGWERTWRLGDRLPKPEPAVIGPEGLGPEGLDPEEVVRQVVRAAYPIRRDDAALRLVSALPPGEKPGHFIRLRNDYPLRREFPATTVRRTDSPEFPGDELSGLGFRLA